MIIIDKLQNPETIKSIFFDIDGTITRWKSVESFLKRALSELNMPYKEEYLNALFRAIKMNEYHTLTTGFLDEEVYANLLGIYIPDLNKYGLTGNDLKNIMFKLEDEETFIDEGTLEELSFLHEEYDLYCYTNWFKAQAVKKLEYHNLLKFFLEVHSPEDVFIKQHAFAFKYILEKYKLKPEQILFVGDSRTDIKPSKKCGIKTIYINYDIKSDDDITKDSMDLILRADASITNFNDIHVVLSKKY